jgi:transaldolase
VSDNNPIQQANRLGQSIWLDSISREMISTGQLKALVDRGVTGVTSNPTIFQKAIAEGDWYDEALAKHSRDGAPAETVFERIAVDDIRDAADVLRPAYDAAGGKDGFVSIEVNPRLAHDTKNTIEEARRLWQSIGRPNVMIKVPGTPEGMPAIRTLIGEGVNVNVTLLFSLNAYRDAANAYLDGLNDLLKSGKAMPSRVASVASFFVSRVDTAADARLPGGHALAGKIGMANARLAYAEFKELFDRNLGGKGRFFPLHTTGAQVQRPLWASTSTKNPEFKDTMYIDGLMGPDTVDTMPQATLDAFADHGIVADALSAGVEQARADMDALAKAGVSIDEVTDELLHAGVKAFADSYETLIDGIREKAAGLAGAGPRS